MQYGSGPYDAYKQASALARTFLKRNYVSADGAQMNVMKCIDFSHSPELDALIAKAIPKTRG